MIPESDLYAFGVRAFGCAIRAAADDADAFELLHRYIFPTFPRSETAPPQPDLDLRLDKTGQEFHLSSAGEIVARSDVAITLIPHLIHVLDEAIVPRLASLRAIHAGTVAWNGRALLLPGSSHSGKSSLVAELLRRGAAYFSDEYALLDVDGQVHPYPRPLLLRNGRPDQLPVLAGDLNATVGDASAQLGWILLLRYQPDGSWRIAPIPQSMALMALLQNTPHTLADSPEMVQTFERAVAGAECFAGERAEANEAADRILELISAAS
jgi:hypothetical protein